PASDSAGRRSREASRTSGRHLRRAHAEARALPRVDAVPPARHAPYLRVHVQRHRASRIVRPRRAMQRVALPAAIAAAIVTAWSRPVRTHETVTTTVLFDREIVR